MAKYTVNIKGNVHGLVQGDGRMLIIRGGKAYTICQVCDGDEACQWCGGDGESDQFDECPSCGGSGLCVACGGAGEVLA